MSKKAPGRDTGPQPSPLQAMHRGLQDLEDDIQIAISDFSATTHFIVSAIQVAPVETCSRDPASKTMQKTCRYLIKIHVRTPK